MRQHHYTGNRPSRATAKRPLSEAERARLDRQGQLQPGDEFRPYDMFNDFAVIPASLMRCKLLTPSERLCLVALGKRLGPTGIAFPSYERLALDLGLDRRQVIRIVASLGKKQFVRIINRPGAKPNESTSNEFRLLWHPALAEQGGDTASPPSDKLSLPPGDGMSLPPSDKVSPIKETSFEKKHFLKKEQRKATSSDDAVRARCTKAESKPQAQYIDQVESLVWFRESVKCAVPLQAGDRAFAASLFDRGVPVEIVEHAMSVASFRWYVAALNGEPLAPIKSLKYFAAEIDAAQKLQVTPSYRAYAADKMMEAERQWLALGRMPSGRSDGEVRSVQGAA